MKWRLNYKIMFNFCENLIIFDLLLSWTLVSQSQSQIETFAKGVANISRTNIGFGELEHNTCADEFQVIMCFR